MNEYLFFEEDIYLAPSAFIYPPKDFPAHYHKHIELVIMTEGELLVNIDGKEEHLHAGDAAFIFPYRIHSYRLQGNSNRFIAVFEPEFFSEFEKIFSNYKLKNPIICADKISSLFSESCCGMQFLPYITKVFCVEDYPNPVNEQSPPELICENQLKKAERMTKLSDIIMLLLEISGIEMCDTEESGIYRKAVKFCCESFTDCDLCVSDVARAVNISVSRLQAIFAPKCGMGVKEHINFLRLTCAENLLISSNLSITDIAMQSGFSSIRTFNRLFRKAKKLSPSEFKQLEH